MWGILCTFEPDFTLNMYMCVINKKYDKDSRNIPRTSAPQGER